MRAKHGLLGAAAAVLVIVTPATPAHARRGACVMGAGEAISHLAEADLSQDPELAAELGFEEPAFGYKYEYFSVFFLDLWTGRGSVVLYDQSSDRYVPLQEDVMQSLTGRSLDSLGKPFLYRVPLGWIVLGIGFVLAAIGAALRSRETSGWE